jgi:hypothetical protein
LPIAFIGIFIARGIAGFATEPPAALTAKDGPREDEEEIDAAGHDRHPDGEDHTAERSA